MLVDQLQAAYRDRFVAVKREPARKLRTPEAYHTVLKFDPGQPRDAQGQWTALPAGYTSHTENTAAYSGQSNFTTRIFDAQGQQVAYADYVIAHERHGALDRKLHPHDPHDPLEQLGWIHPTVTTMYRPEVSMSMIAVAPSHRRKGLGMALLRTIAHEHQLPINSGMRTEEGGKLWDKWVMRPERLVKFDPEQLRDAKGRWVKISERMATLKAKYPVVAHHYPRSTGTEMGSIESHTGDVGREWGTQLTHKELSGISKRFGSDVEALMASAIPLHDIGKAEAIESGGGKRHQHEHTIPILQDVLQKEGFSERDISLATEVMNHDLVGQLFQGRGKDTDVATKLVEKAKMVGMKTADFVTLQLAFYQADAAAYPYITQYMKQEPSGKWTFSGAKQIAAIEALTRRKVAREWVAKKFDPGQPRNAQGQWTEVGGGWHRGPGGERPYGDDHPSGDAYTVPKITHTKLIRDDRGAWGGSHHGSQTITGESAKIMGISGYKDLNGDTVAQNHATKFLEAIAQDTAGSEETLYHVFQNVKSTEFKVGDTLKLPLTASAGDIGWSYGVRLEAENQEGQPTVLEFEPGTQMAPYGSYWTKRQLQEEGQTRDEVIKEFGYVWSEAIVAGAFEVTGVKDVFVGSQHSERPEAGVTHQIMGKAVRLRQIKTFDPETKQWVPRG